MKRTFTYQDSQAILYLVATPIGNLDDMSFRAINTLKTVYRIYAEDTRNSKVLLDKFNIETPIHSYHEYNKELKEDEIITLLKQGHSIAIISDAGLPAISDPGYDIAKRAIEEDIPVSPIPGASAGISGLIASGLVPQPFMFYGFLDSKKSKRIKQLEELKVIKCTIIFHEAPHRIYEMLTDLYEVFGNRQAVIARELTKRYEEFIRGSLEELSNYNEQLKGEMVVIVEGAKDEPLELKRNPIELVKEYISLGYKPKEAIKEVANTYNLDKHQLYDDYVRSKNEA